MIPSRLSAALESGIESGDHFGGQIYISRKGEVIVDSSFGFNSPTIDQDFEPETLMLWRSAGKPLTAVGIASLLNQNKISFDTPVVDVIPEFTGPGKEDVTIRHLLSHTAGMRLADKLSESLPWNDMIQRICQTPIEESWDLSQSAGYHIAGTWYLLGEICLRITNTSSFSQWIRDQVLLPLGMLDTYIGIPETQWEEGLSQRISPIYLTSTNPPSSHPYLDSKASCCGCRPGGNTRGPANDLGRFYEWCLNPSSGPEHLSSTMPALIQNARHPGLFDQTFRHKMDWGLGFMVNSSRYGKLTVPYGFGQYASLDTFGHGGAQCSCGFADPEHQLVVVWILNGMPGEIRHQKRVRAINDAIYADLNLENP